MQRRTVADGTGDKDFDRLIKMVRAEKARWEKVRCLPDAQFDSDDESERYFNDLKIELLHRLKYHDLTLREQCGFDISKLNMGLSPFANELVARKLDHDAQIYQHQQEYKYCYFLLEMVDKLTERVGEAKMPMSLIATQIVHALHQWSCRAWPIIVFSIRPTWAAQREEYLLLLSGWVATQISMTEKGATKRVSVALSRRNPGVAPSEALLSALPGVMAELAAITSDNAGNFFSYLTPRNLLEKLPGKAEYAIENEHSSVAERLQGKHRMSKRQDKGPKPEQDIFACDNDSPLSLEEWQAREAYEAIDTRDWLNSLLQPFSKRQKQVFDLYTVQEKNAEEVAHILGISPSTVRNTNKIVKDRLKTLLNASDAEVGERE